MHIQIQGVHMGLIDLETRIVCKNLIIIICSPTPRSVMELSTLNPSFSGWNFSNAGGIDFEFRPRKEYDDRRQTWKVMK